MTYGKTANELTLKKHKVCDDVEADEKVRNTTKNITVCVAVSREKSVFYFLWKRPKRKIKRASHSC